MDLNKQKLLMEYLVSSPDTFARCSGIIEAEYFDPTLRNAVGFIQDYYEAYNTTPSEAQIRAESGTELKQVEVKKDQLNYCAAEVETFCKRRAIENAIRQSPEMIANNDYGAVEQSIKDAIMVSLNKNLGVRYFEDVDERLERMLKENSVESTSWKEVDELLFGGLGRREMILFAASSGGGKSITLANLALNFVERGGNALYISLELSEDVVAQRFDTMITGVSRKDWKAHVSEVSTRVEAKGEKCGILDIAHMNSGSTSNDIRAYLKEYYLHYDMMPDILVVDYLDKMAPNQKVSADNVWEKDKQCAEQVRDIGYDYNMVVATASQLNRSAVGATHHDHSQIAGGISKINETDVYISIIMTETMKAAGEMSFVFQKTRNSDGVGKTVYMKWDNKYLRIRDGDRGPGDSLEFIKKQSGGATLLDREPSGKQSLMDLMRST